tara:strand:- start:248 stop:1300 length:1053 start_codon:yes stop_codon:yes gene_type:complete
LKITANMVTMTRIFLMPVPCLLLLYGDAFWRWVAVFCYTVLATTDFIDGYMARRDGPTKIGGLIDPVADKIFIAALFFPLASMEVAPAWFIVAIFVRELLVTGLRSSVAWRKASITTSRLAKMKTIIQLGGAVSIFLVLSLQPYQLMAFAVFLAVITALGWLFMLLRKKRKPFFWMLPTIPCYILVAGAVTYADQETVILIHLMVIAGLTLVSGFDYLLGAFGLFKSSGVSRYDLVRLAWGLSWPLLALPAVAWTPVAMLPLLVAISCELTIGGVDNVAVAEKEVPPDTLNFLISAICAAIFGVGYWMEIWGGSLPMVAPWIPGLGLAAVSLTLMVFSFKRHGDLFKKVI